MINTSASVSPLFQDKAVVLPSYSANNNIQSQRVEAPS